MKSISEFLTEKLDKNKIAFSLKDIKTITPDHREDFSKEDLKHTDEEYAKLLKSQGYRKVRSQRDVEAGTFAVLKKTAYSKVYICVNIDPDTRLNSYIEVNRYNNGHRNKVWAFVMHMFDTKKSGGSMMVKEYKVHMEESSAYLLVKNLNRFSFKELLEYAKNYNEEKNGK